MIVYIDESGDLGFTFNKPFRDGGSSRYLTISFLLIPGNLSYLTKRIVKDLYSQKKKSIEKELKGNKLTLNDKIFVAYKLINLLSRHPRIKVFAITVDKRKVKPHIREDANKLYNYMIGLILPNRIKGQSRVTLIPDQRSIKVESGNSLIDYLKIKLYFELDSSTTLNYCPLESHTTLNLLFIDWISHIIWEKYEDGEIRAYNIIKSKINLTHLFFS